MGCTLALLSFGRDLDRSGDHDRSWRGTACAEEAILVAERGGQVQFSQRLTRGFAEDSVGVRDVGTRKVGDGGLQGRETSDELFEDMLAIDQTSTLLQQA